jgi:Pyridoxamine 5'-phosphate oxidase
MRWDAFVAVCPEIGERAAERYAQDEVVLLGTLRRDGSPRISPCEPDVVAGHLLLGMMWRSQKVIDIERDPRVAVHSKVPDRESPQGDIKLYGRAVAIEDPGLRRAYREAIFRRIAWAPEEPAYHLYALDVASAGFTMFGDAPYALAWDVERGIRRKTLSPPEI